MYGFNKAALIISALIDSGATHIFKSKSLVKKLQLPLFLNKSLQNCWMMAQSSPVRRRSMMHMGLYLRMLNRLVSG